MIKCHEEQSCQEYRSGPEKLFQNRKKRDKEVKVTRMNMMNREDKEQKSKLRIIGVPKEEIKRSL